MKRKSEGGNKQPFQRPKVELVFDPQKRAEFLGGFHKRKLHRRKIAQGEMQRKLKEETRRIRAEAKENLRKLYQSQKPIPELADQEEKEEEEDEYDTENVTVKVVELSTSVLAKENHWIGENRAPKDDADGDEEQQNEQSDDDEGNRLGVVPGMELEGEHKVRRKSKPFAERGDEEGEPSCSQKATEQEKPKQKKGPVLNLEGIRSKKELNHKLKRYALKSMKKSQVFRQKNRIQKQKQLKESRRVRHFKEKHLKQKKGNRRPGGGREPTRRRKDDD
ncbi:nucleolar protein 12 [Anopheles bellator]|uniref:nucleolar protein 12 n=1 Tax=Anopheles bellator TaxID=139047 RepID=UPI00264A3631|nr:nucleolar protein 12 [Anopheles bellator]